MTVDVVTTLLALLSVAVFVAHALDAYRAAARAEQKLRARSLHDSRSPLLNSGSCGL